MRANIFRFFCIVTTLCLTLTSYTPIQGSDSDGWRNASWGVDASAYVREVRVRDGVKDNCTEHKASAYAEADMYGMVNGQSYYNSGSYTIGSELNGGVKDSDGNYYSGEMTDRVKVTRHYHDPPNNVSGWGDADSTIYGVRGLYDSAYHYLNF